MDAEITPSIFESNKSFMSEEDLLNTLTIFYSNLTPNVDRSEFDLVKKQSWKIFIIVLYVIVILFGLIGNLLVFLVIVRTKHLQTVTNIFIINLTFADILLCVFNLPFQLHYQLTDYWSFGATLCRIIMPTFGMPVFVSCLSILMIAIDRYILIVHPFLPRMTKTMAISLVIGIGVMTLGLAVPLMVYTELVIIDEPLFKIYKAYCTEVWPSYLVKQVYSVMLFALQFFFPIIVTSVLYCRIYLVLKRRPLKRNESKKSNKTNAILVAIVLLFTICWLPWNLFSLSLEFNHRIIPGQYTKFVDLLLKIFAMSSACINPFLYGWLNDNFRKELEGMLGLKRQNPTAEGYRCTSTADPSKMVKCQNNLNQKGVTTSL